MSRTKTEKVVWRTTFRTQDIACDSWGGAWDPPTNIDRSYTDTVTYGDNYKDWRSRLANGEQCTTSLSGTKYSRKRGPVTSWSNSQSPLFPYITCANTHYIATRHGFRDGELFPYEFSYPGSDSTSLVRADAIALGQFVAKIREVQTSFQGGVFLGELGETIRMLSSPAKSLREGLGKYLTSLKKRKRTFRNVRNPLKRLRAAQTVLADTWLEFSFGWKPLVHDIDDAAKTLANRLASSPKWQPVTAVGRDEQTASVATGSNCGTNMGSIINRYLYTTTKEVHYKGQVNVVHPSQNASWHAGFIPSDWAPTVWELIPYSFLVDYFANLGQIISCASLLQTNLRWSAKTTVEKISQEIVDSYFVPGVSSFFSRAGGTGRIMEKQTKTTFSRAPYNGSLVPSLQFHLPGHDVQWINMAALFVGNRSQVPFHR